MNKLFSKALLLALLTVLVLAACKKKESSEPAKTLNKSTLTKNKTWFNQGSTIIHTFNTTGVYSSTGTWEWVNNSDTMLIMTTPTSFPSYWKFFWNTDHEMSCQRVSSSSSVELYKDNGW